MPNSECVVVFVATGAAEEAALISKVLLKQIKAACISVVEVVNTMYW